MNNESHSSPPEPTPARGRDNLQEAAAGLVARLDGSRWFRPLALAVAAILTGLLLAPQLAIQTYPTDPHLVGTPAASNYKAPHDVEVIDDEMTEHLRDAAVADVKRVYDFDVLLGARIGDSIETAFSLVRQATETFLLEHPEQVDHLSHAQEMKLRDALLQILSHKLPDFEKTLGTALRQEERDSFAELRFEPQLGRIIAKAVRDAMAQPIIAADVTLDPDRTKGISLQRIPDDGATPRSVTDLDSILELEEVRREFGARVRRLFPDLPVAVRELAAAVGARLLEANLAPNRAATDLAREVARLSVQPVTISVKKGEMVIRDGERLTRRHLLIFQAVSDSAGSASVLLAVLGAAAAVLILIAVGLSSTTARGRGLNLNNRDFLFLTSLFVAAVAGARFWLLISTALHDRFGTWPFEAFLFLMPIAGGAMITRLVLRADVGVWFGVLSSLVLGLLIGGERPFTLYAAVGSILGATLIGNMSARGDLLKAGVRVGAGQAVAAAALELFAGQTEPLSYLIAMAAGLAGGVLASLLTLAVTPVVESLFGYSTDLKLLELANLNHPALKELIVQAPGSYHHSVIVGSLVEAAAEAIGANPLLARVMAYYHDIGKGSNPGYFIENQRAGQNPHDKLKPSMSAMIIKRHVTDGLEMARRHRLGEPIKAAIAEHHGTTLIHFFHHRAKEQAEDQNTIAESDYRYPGRKPQSREAALVMLGDAVEAAARSLNEPTPARLQGLISRIVNLKFTDQQLEECDITLRDLHTIARSFSRILNSIYHHRPEYPDLLKDISGKKPNGDTDPKSPKKPQDPELPPEDLRPDNLRRLGLS
jgi:cyclic-di-AMP phosphodiesterase PgpH